jgi:2-phosphosulfolactate phosphatase
VSETVAIDFSPERAITHGEGAAIIAVDVIRATTTAVTGVVLGRDCYPVPSLEVAVPLAARLHRPLLVGELGGNRPYGFDLTNSPYELAHRTDVERPMILLSTSGTRLISAPPRAEHVYVACLRNWRAQAAWMVGRHERVVVLGAGTRGEFREEDQLCCAWIARELVAAGYAPHDERTRKLIRRWSDEPVEGMLVSNSVAYLRETEQEDDLEFIMSHVDDVDGAFEMRGNRLVPASVDGNRNGTSPPTRPVLHVQG